MTQAKKSVLFSFHAAERIKQRLSIAVSTKHETEISNTFFKAKVYKSTDNGRMVEAWACKDSNTRVVLIVDKISNVVQTVLTGGELNNNRPAPFVDSCYA